MSRSSGTFVDLCLGGSVLAEEIDDFVDAWHDGDSSEPIYDYLGMTRDEYGLWVEKPRLLHMILEARKRGKHLEDYRDADSYHRMAARTVSEDDIGDLVLWLKQTGRLPVDA